MAGCIAHSLAAWRKITSDKEILSIVMGLRIDLMKRLASNLYPHVRPASEEAVIDLEVGKLLSKSVIEPTGQ